MVGEGCKVGNDSGTGGLEKAFVVNGGKDMFVPKEGKMIILERWGLWC